MIQALSGFVALRDMVRHTESQFHLRQFDWVIKLWCRRQDNNKWCATFVLHVLHVILPPEKRKTFEHIYFCILFTLYSTGLDL